MATKKASGLSPKNLKQALSQGNISDYLDESDLNTLENIILEIKEKKIKKNDAPEYNSTHQRKNDVKEKKLQFIVDNQDLLQQALLNGKKKKFRQSGHLTDQTLKYKHPSSRQMSLFDVLSNETVEKIQETKFEVKAEGIRLTPPEDRILKALCRLLHEKCDTLSEEFDPNDGAFQLCPYGKDQKAKAPILRISPSELYKAYLDRLDYSGEEIKFIKKTLNDLSRKMFLIIYDRKRTVKNKTVTDRIEEFQPLVKIMSFHEGLSDAELKKLEAGDQNIRDKRGELIIGLNPIFIDQIGSKYIEYPSDINKRTTIAAGGHLHVTESIIVLRDYMLREISANREQAEINEDRLPYLLHLEGYLKRRRKKQVQERITKAIDTVKNLGIIKDFKCVIGSKGQSKYIFFLNKDFE
jgi:hypothetical protein